MKQVLFIHGFTAEEKDYDSFFNHSSSNLCIHHFQLPGHDGTYPKLTYHDWIQKAEAELKELLKQTSTVSLVGHSMGGVIASYLAATYKEVDKLVLLAPAFYYGSPYEQIVSHLQKPTNPDLIISRNYEKINQYPKHYFLEFLKLLRHLRPYIQKVTCPILILHGEKDHIISVRSTLHLAHKLKGDVLFTRLPNIRHRILESSKKELVISYIESYLLNQNFNYKNKI